MLIVLKRRIKDEIKLKNTTMPIKRCQANGKDGYKYGDAGKCYTGAAGKKKAAKQAAAIKIKEAEDKKRKYR